MKKALVVFSGGQDSTTCLGWAIKNFDEVQAISYVYGQKHKQEVKIAQAIAKNLGIKHHFIDISFFGEIADSALTHDGDVNEKHSRFSHLPASFVPNRNLMFLTIAHSLAQKIGYEHLVTGVCETDYSGYPDCRDDFVKQTQATLNMSSEARITIWTPLMFLNKAQTWKLAEEVGVLEIVKEQTLTCYNGVMEMNEWGYGCGACPACLLRKKGWEEYQEKI